MSSKRVIIFDFDGTIADTVPVIIDIFHKVERRKTRLTKDEELLVRAAALLQVKMKTIIRDAIRIGIPLWRLPFIFAISQAILSRRMHEVKAFPGMKQLIAELHAEGNMLFIVSANTPSNIKKFLKNEGLSPYFTKVYGSVRSSRKAKIIARIAKKHNAHSGNVFYIGDESRDIHAAQAAGVGSIGVRWGYNDEAQLRASEPQAIATKASDIATLLRRTK